MSSMCRSQIAILRNYALYRSNTRSIPILTYWGPRIVYFLSKVLSKTTLRMGSWLDRLYHSKSAKSCVASPDVHLCKVNCNHTVLHAAAPSWYTSCARGVSIQLQVELNSSVDSTYIS